MTSSSSSSKERAWRTAVSARERPAQLGVVQHLGAAPSRATPAGARGLSLGLQGGHHEEDPDRTDGSESALEALEFGLELAEEQDATAFLVHVAPAVEVVPYANFAAPAPRVPHELDDDDRVPLTEAAEIAALKGVDAKTELLVGNPADEIVAFGDTIDADLIWSAAWPRRDRERAARQRLAGRAPREPAARARVRAAHVAAEAAVT